MSSDVALHAAIVTLLIISYTDLGMLAIDWDPSVRFLTMLPLSFHTGPVFESIRKARRNTVGRSIVVLLDITGTDRCCLNVQGNPCQAPRLRKRDLSLTSTKSMCDIARREFWCGGSHRHCDEYVG